MKKIEFIRVKEASGTWYHTEVEDENGKMVTVMFSHFKNEEEAREKYNQIKSDLQEPPAREVVISETI